MKMFLVVLGFVFTISAQAQTTFGNADPKQDLVNYYDNADVPTIEDFPSEKDGEGFLDCHYWNENSKEWTSFAKIIKFEKTWSEGGHAGRGPLFPANPGVQKSKKGLAFRGNVDDPDKVQSSTTEFRWYYYERPFFIFRKKDKYFFFKTSAGDVDFYGYCWNDKDK